MTDPTVALHPNQIKLSFGKPILAPLFFGDLGPAVYFYSHDAVVGLIKVGYTGDLVRRLGELNHEVTSVIKGVGSKQSGSYVLVWPATDKRAEGWLHGEFKGAQVIGPWGREWFHSPPIMTWIEALLNQGGWSDDA